MSPRVSIGVPVYNGERYLQHALDSILAQSFTDFELLISDNASTDGTERICREYAAADSRVHYTRWDVNEGAARNYNRLVEMASGKYFKWAAHDDICAPGLLGQCVAALDSSPPSVVLCYPKTILIDENGAKVGTYKDNMDLRLPQPHQRLHHLLQHLRMCNAVFGLIRTDALRKTRMIGNFVASDMVLLAELCLLGEFREVPERLFLRRRHQEASCFAHQSPEERAVWFDPRNKGRWVFPMLEMLVQHFRAIARTRISASEKMRCYKVAIAYWLPKWRAIGGECKQALKRRLKLQAA